MKRIPDFAVEKSKLCPICGLSSGEGNIFCSKCRAKEDRTMEFNA